MLQHPYRFAPVSVGYADANPVRLVGRPVDQRHIDVAVFMAHRGGVDEGKRRRGEIGLAAIAIDGRLDVGRCDGWPGNRDVELTARHLLAVLLEYVVNGRLVGIAVTDRAD